MIDVINGIVIKDYKLLVVKKKDVWILPGSKLDKGESHLECLSREFMEELSGTRIYGFQHYKNFEGITPYSKKKVNVITNFVNLKGKLGKPSMEISDQCYVPLCQNPSLDFSNITWNVMLSLRREGYLAL
jgi:8-oxo-dGTP pyrophosphatase MutT (NUDIX family)